MAEGAVRVFSAHLDDAVLSASVQLARPGAEVVTVFAGAPPEDVENTEWGRLTRASSAAERHRERLAEDDAAMSALGCAWRRLDEPEDEFRTGAPDLGRLADRLRPDVADAAEIWIPAGIGGHPDHVALRRAVLAALDAAGDRATPVHLYADLPYTIAHGWPTWVTGAEPADYLDPDRWVVDELVGNGVDPAGLARRAVRLAADERARKARAVRAYRSQLPALGLGPADTHRWTALLAHEAAWRLAR
ncbi:PIG-L deacetylase family protein [Actinomadura chibensis]|uniref:PIG-L deacetylase family protein n=1 Tax=Actinomadura chibensis TaxID=392828 RepID=UPI000834B114|nr:PIG-L family deacetylase [Actinomadura chibensis]